MDDVVTLLQDLGCFEEFARERLISLGPALRSISLAAGDELVAVGEVADEVYVVLAGRLEAVTADGDGTSVLAELLPGSVVGEIAVLTGGRRNATLRASEPTLVAAITAEAFRQLLVEAPELAGRIAADARRRLRQTQLARHLDALFPGDGVSDLGGLVTRMEMVPLTAGEVLFRAGDDGDAAYVVVAGRLRVLTEDADGRISPLAEVGRGELVGELALLDGLSRTATVVAARDTELARLTRAAFDALVRHDPGLMLAITRTIVRRARDADDLHHRAAGDGLSIGLLPLGPEVDVAGLASELAGRLAATDTVEHLTSAGVDRRLGLPGIADVAPGDSDALRLERLLAETEDRARLVLFEGDARVSPWTRRCVTQVDHLVLVADANGHPGLTELERLLVTARDLPHQHVSLVLFQEPDLDRPRGTSAWLEPRDVDQHHHVRRGNGADLDRLARHLAGRAVTLVFSGGGAKGFAHLGVVRAMRELGIPIDAVAGSSMGAPLAGVVAQEVPDDEHVPFVARLYRKVLDYTVPVASLISARRIVDALEDGTDGRDIEDTWLPYVCVSTNLTRSRTVVHRRGSLAFAMRASLSIPGVMPPVPYGEDLLVDGGVLNNLPVDVARRLNPTGIVIASDVAPRLGPRVRSEFGLHVSGTRVLARRLVPGMKAPRVPALSATLMRSLLVAAAQQRDHHLAAGLVDLHLQLELSGVGLLDFDTTAPVEQQGYDEALPLLTGWLAVTDHAQ